MIMSTVPQATGVRDIAKKCFELAYKDIAPANITLGLLIIILNCLVIAYYRRNISKLTPALFVCIACCDISAAVGNIVFGVGVLLWFHGPKSSAETTMWWCYVTYRSEEQCGDNNVVVLCDLQVRRAVRRQQCGGAM